MSFADFEAVLFDIDGTLCAHRKALPGAVETITHLQAAGIPAAFVTNNSASTLGSQVARLSKLGICVDAKFYLYIRLGDGGLDSLAMG